ASDAPLDAFFAAAGLAAAAPAGADDWFPFDLVYCRPLLATPTGGASQIPDTTADFLQRHYYGPSSDPADQDQSWRRIDQDWLGTAAQFALQLDSATNNTSLVLAIELSPGGEVLLFAADANSNTSPPGDSSM